MNQDSPVAADNAATTSADRHRSDDAPRTTGSSEGGEGAAAPSSDGAGTSTGTGAPRRRRSRGGRGRSRSGSGAGGSPGSAARVAPGPRTAPRPPIGNLPARRATTDPPRLLVPGPHARLARPPRHDTTTTSDPTPKTGSTPRARATTTADPASPETPTSVDGASGSPTGAPKRRRRRGGRGRGGGGGGARAGTTGSPSNGQGRASDDESATTATPGPEPHPDHGREPHAYRIAHVRREAAPLARHRRRRG